MEYYQRELLLLLLIVCTGKACKQLHFVQTPIDQTVEEGHNIMLHCAVSSHNHVQISWEKDGEALMNTSRHHQDDTDLVILGLDSELDSGAYRCVATNITSGVTLISGHAWVNVIDSEVNNSAVCDQLVFNPAPMNQTLSDGGNITLHCDVTNRHHVKIWWEKDREVLMNTSRRHQDDTSLVILGLDSKLDSGAYRCVATNITSGVTLISGEAWLQKVPVTMEVYMMVPGDKPITSPRPVGGIAFFSCHADIYPAHLYKGQVHWIDKDGREITSTTGRVRVNTISSVSQNLYFYDIQEEYAGKYSCVAEDADSHGEESIILRVTDDLGVELRPDVDPLVKAVSNMAYFNCYIPFEIEVNLRWIRENGSEITADPGRVYTLPSERGGNLGLLFDDVEAEDEGLYTCTAESGSRYGENSVSLLILHYFRIDSAPSPQVFKAGEDALLVCRVSGDPPPTVWWQMSFDGIWSTLNTDGENPYYHYSQEEGFLLMPAMKVRDSGEYRCIVGYPELYDFEQSDIEVIVEE